MEACIAARFFLPNEQTGLSDQLRFLITAHDLTRVVIIAHADCGFYAHQMRDTPDGIFAAQLDDLAAAAEIISGMKTGLIVDAYFARVEGETVLFEAIPVGDSHPEA